MRQRSRQGRGLIGWALGALAALTLIVAAPQHVLDFDDDGPATAAAAAPLEVETHGHAHTVLDHAAPGHACAGHCAAHVMGDAPLPTVILPPIRMAAIWPAAATQDGQAHPPTLFDRPPKA